MELREFKRYPFRKGDPLQAWDSADELLLSHLAGLDLTGRRILVLGDSFGAIARSLERFTVTSYTDSYVATRGACLNGVDPARLVHDPAEFTGVYDYVLIRIPKNLSFLEDLLCRLTPHLNSDSKVIGAVMVKHLAKGAFDFLGRIIGPTSTSLAQKKARLIFASFEKGVVASPYPLRITIEGFDRPFIHHSNLFSREKIDIGTRFFLQHIPRGNFKSIVDLGCANGIIGIRAKALNPEAKIIFTDESAMAIASARANFIELGGGEVEFHWTNSYETGPTDSTDLALCNPPFHDGNAIGNHVAIQMFADAHRVLRTGGQLRVIGNFHLRYASDLRRQFGNCEIVAKHPKFTIWDAKKKQ